MPPCLEAEDLDSDILMPDRAANRDPGGDWSAYRPLDPSTRPPTSQRATRLTQEREKKKKKKNTPKTNSLGLSLSETHLRYGGMKCKKGVHRPGPLTTPTDKSTTYYHRQASQAGGT